MAVNVPMMGSPLGQAISQGFEGYMGGRKRRGQDIAMRYMMGAPVSPEDMAIAGQHAPQMLMRGYEFNQQAEQQRASAAAEQERWQAGYDLDVEGEERLQQTATDVRLRDRMDRADEAERYVYGVLARMHDRSFEERKAYYDENLVIPLQEMAQSSGIPFERFGVSPTYATELDDVILRTGDPDYMIMFNPETGDRKPMPTDPRERDALVRQGYIPSGGITPTGDVGSMTSSELQDFRAASDTLRRTEDFIDFGRLVISHIAEDPTAGSLANELAGWADKARRNIGIGLQLMDASGEGEAAQEVRDFMAEGDFFDPGTVTAFRSAGISADVLDSMTITLAYMFAKARDPSGRIAKDDFVAAMAAIGESSEDPLTMKANIENLMEMSQRSAQRVLDAYPHDNRPQWSPGFGPEEDVPAAPEAGTGLLGSPENPHILSDPATFEDAWGALPSGSHFTGPDGVTRVK